jgi:large subunit ribosomal protein L18
VKASEKYQKRERRHRRVRRKIVGTNERPRLSVFRSARHIYAQLIDDAAGQTLVSSSTLKLGAIKAGDKEGVKITAAREVGKQLAEKAKEKGIARVCFDRGGFIYHGRVAALADAARQNGLEF